MTERKTRRLDAAGLFDYALRTLGARAHATGELREKLLRRAERAGDVPAVLGRLKEYGYLNDRKFAEAFSTARLENERLGKMRVLADLRKRRVAPAVAEKAVAEAYRDTDEMALIEEYLRRKFRGKQLDKWLAEPKNLASAYRRLRGAGFSSGNSIRALKRFAAEAELLESMEDEAGGPQAPES